MEKHGRAAAGALANVFPDFDGKVRIRFAERDASHRHCDQSVENAHLRRTEMRIVSASPARIQLHMHTRTHRHTHTHGHRHRHTLPE